jgi:hypothetical protein
MFGAARRSRLRHRPKRTARLGRGEPPQPHIKTRRMTDEDRSWANLLDRAGSPRKVRHSLGSGSGTGGSGTGTGSRGGDGIHRRCPRWWWWWEDDIPGPPEIGWRAHVQQDADRALVSRAAVPSAGQVGVGSDVVVLAKSPPHDRLIQERVLAAQVPDPLP